MPNVATGALIGWKRTVTDHGVMLTMQVAQSKADFNNRDFQIVEVAMNDRQLRSFTRDLIRAANTRGIILWTPRPWWKFWVPVGPPPIKDVDQPSR